LVCAILSQLILPEYHEQVKDEKFLHLSSVGKVKNFRNDYPHLQNFTEDFLLHLQSRILIYVIVGSVLPNQVENDDDAVDKFRRIVRPQFRF
jgi:hypothetical protein